jgi:hypothetical protein
MDTSSIVAMRLPFTTLNFSPRRYAPPESVLPELARRGDLLLICPLPNIGSPAWVEFYRYWSSPESHPDLSEKWGKFPLREVGRIRQYIIYRVEPELASAKLIRPACAAVAPSVPQAWDS